MRYADDAAVAGDGERIGVHIRRTCGLEAAETEPDNTAVAVTHGPTGRFVGRFHVGGAVEVGGEAERHTMLLHRLHSPVAVTLEEVLPAHSSRDPFDRRKDRLDLGRTMTRGLF